MASVYQTQEWRQGGGTAKKHPLDKGLGGGSGQRDKWDPNSFGGRIARLEGLPQESALEGLEYIWKREICSLGTEKETQGSSPEERPPGKERCVQS